jgi:type IV secretory pathway VirB6-like protein
MNRPFKDWNSSYNQVLRETLIQKYTPDPLLTLVAVLIILLGTLFIVCMLILGFKAVFAATIVGICITVITAPILWYMD